jgi:hypothetical protein
MLPNLDLSRIINSLALLIGEDEKYGNLLIYTKYKITSIIVHWWISQKVGRII